MYADDVCVNEMCCIQFDLNLSEPLQNVLVIIMRNFSICSLFICCHLLNLSLYVKQTNCYVTSSGVHMTRETYFSVFAYHQCLLQMFLMCDMQLMNVANSK